MKRIWLLWPMIGLLGLSSAAQAGRVCVLETEKGTLVFRMFPEVAPRTVSRIGELADSGFFDGIVFHRVVADFVVQAGDPTGTGEGGSGQTIPAEFSHVHYIRGSVGMARDDDSIAQASDQDVLRFAGHLHAVNKRQIGQLIGDLQAYQIEVQEI